MEAATRAKRVTIWKVFMVMIYKRQTLLDDANAIMGDN